MGPLRSAVCATVALLGSCSSSTAVAPDPNVAIMKADLRSLANAQERYLIAHKFYGVASASGILPLDVGIPWVPSSGTVVVIAGTAGSSTGWNAQVSRAGTAVTCSLYVGAGGTGVFVSSGQQENEPSCF